MHEGTRVWDSQLLAGEHSLLLYLCNSHKGQHIIEKNDVLLKVVINYYQSLFQ